MRRLTAFLGAVLLVAVLPGGAAAAPPGNDLPAGAIALALPATIEFDTAEATVGTDDVGCGAGGVDQATVWYTLTLPEATSVLVDASESDYGVGVNVFEGAASPEALIACSIPAASFEAAAGTTYFLMFADADGDATNGGLLRATVDLAPPPIEMVVTVDPVAKLGAKGATALIRGTISCSRPADFTEVYLRLFQAVGRFTIHGSGFDSPSCGPDAAAWAVEVAAENGRFAGSKATLELQAFACDAVSCAEQLETFNLRFRR